MRLRILAPLIARFALALALFCPSLALAGDNKKAPPPEYTEAVNQALSELEANNYPEALAEFKRAHAIFPNARTLRGLGMVEFELRHYAQSKSLLQQALASTVKPLEGKLKADTEALLDRTRRYLSELKVQYSPGSATVTVDGASGHQPSEVGYELEVGEHVVEVRASGYATERRTVNVTGGESLSITVRLESLAPTPVAAAAPVQPSSGPGAPVDSPTASQPTYKKWWVWTTVAVVVAGGAVATALLVKRKQDEEPVQGPNALPNVALQSLESTR